MLWLVLTLFLTPSYAQDSVYGPVVVKQRDKVRARWTIEDWFVLKKRRRAQDQWLAWNTKKGPHFELLADIHGGSAKFERQGTDETDEDFRIGGGGVQIHYGLVGLGITRKQYKIKEKDQYWEEDSGTLYLRLLGPSTQSTQLTLLGGIAKSDHEYYGKFDQTFYGALTNIYIFRYFGLEAQFRQKSSGDSDSHKIESIDYHWGFFWELSILRVYALYQQNFNRATRKSDDTKDFERIHGTVLGARLYF